MATIEATGDGRIQKMDVDYSTTVDEKVPKCEQLTKVMTDDEAMILWPNLFCNTITRED